MLALAPLAPVLGSVRSGGYLRLKSPVEPVHTDATCGQGWLSVAPDGFVCESSATTRDGDGPEAAMWREHALSYRAALPASYGIAEDTPVYAPLPLRRDAVVPSTSVTASLPAGSRVAWVAELVHGERRSSLPPSSCFCRAIVFNWLSFPVFHGVERWMRGVAFIGGRPEAKYRRDEGSGRFVPARDTWPAEYARSPLEPPDRYGEAKYSQTFEPGVYLDLHHAISSPTPRPPPVGISKGVADPD